MLKPRMKLVSRAWSWLVVAMCTLPLMGFWLYGLTDVDEGFYGAVVAEMMRRGEWVTPYFAGAPWFEKPILTYWLTIPSVRMFGEAIGPRLPSVLCTLATAWVVYAFSRRRFGHTVALLSSAAYGTCLLVVGVGRMLLTDAPLVLCLTIAFTSFADSLLGAPKMRLVTAAALGFAVLAKGPMALALFAVLAVWNYAAEPTLRPEYRRWWLLGTAILAAVVASWYLPCYLANGHAFVQEFLIKQNIGRFAGGDAAHTLPLWTYPLFYPVLLLLGAAPWSWWLWKAWPSSEGHEPDLVALRFLGRWFLVVLILFTLSGSKLPHYILPALPPMAIIVADWLARRKRTGWTCESWLRLGACLSVATFVAANVAFSMVYRGQFADVQSLALWAREQKGTTVLYRMGRQGDSPPRIQLSLEDTSHPSLFFYLRGDAVQLDEIEDVLKLAKPAWVITREGLVTQDDVRAAAHHGVSLKEVPRDAGRYRLYKLEPLGR